MGSRSRDSAFRLETLLVLLLWTAYGASAEQRPTRPRAIEMVMQDLSEGLTGVEEAIRKADSADVAKRLERFAETVREIGAIPLADYEHLRAECAGRLAQLVSESIELARLGNLDDVENGLADARATCISCHVRTRSSAEDKVQYPARGNVVAGRVVVYRPDGEVRDESSNVVVFLDGLASDRAYPLPRKNPVVSQKDRTFAPRVLPILRGTEVDFPNDDTVFHNVFSLSRAKPFDLDIYRAGEVKSVRFPNAGLVKVYCNIHPNMATNILVLDNPYFTVTGDDGSFVVSEVPDGEYTLRAWSELGGDSRREIRLAGGRIHRVRLDVRETRKTLDHTNKFGKPYRSKYR